MHKLPVPLTQLNRPKTNLGGCAWERIPRRKASRRRGSSYRTQRPSNTYSCCASRSVRGALVPAAAGHEVEGVFAGNRRNERNGPIGIFFACDLALPLAEIEDRRRARMVDRDVSQRSAHIMLV
jgi:hypothetical protein